MAAPIALHAGRAECQIWPEIGGSIGRWVIDEQEILRRTSREQLARKEPLAMASFPLVPYSNRIGFARFDWADQTVLLQANFSPEPHSIHGTGWTSAWEAERLGPGTVILRLVHHANADWYWPFEAEQRITLSANALEIQADSP